MSEPAALNSDAGNPRTATACRMVAPKRQAEQTYSAKRFLADRMYQAVQNLAARVHSRAAKVSIDHRLIVPAAA